MDSVAQWINISSIVLGVFSFINLSVDDTTQPTWLAGMRANLPVIWLGASCFIAASIGYLLPLLELSRGTQTLGSLGGLRGSAKE